MNEAASPAGAIKDRRIFVAGHRGMVGSAIVRRLQAGGYRQILTAPRSQLDLTNGPDTRTWLEAHRPDHVIIAAARVGGIHANQSQPADFITDNLAIALNLITAANAAGIDRLMFLGSSCIYPRDCPQPIREDYLLSGPLEPTNEPYAIAKIAGIKLCEAFNRQHGRRYVSVMPTNLYGPNDNYDLQTSHVLPALIRKAHEARQAQAREMVLWGSGTPRREFLHADDLADACVFLMEQDYAGPLVNIGTGEDIAIADLARLVCRIVGFEGSIRLDPSKPDGTPRKLMDVSRLHGLGWRHRIDLEAGIAHAYEDFRSRPIASSG